MYTTKQLDTHSQTIYCPSLGYTYIHFAIEFIMYKHRAPKYIVVV